MILTCQILIRNTSLIICHVFFNCWYRYIPIKCKFTLVNNIWYFNILNSFDVSDKCLNAHPVNSGLPRLLQSGPKNLANRHPLPRKLELQTRHRYHHIYACVIAFSRHKDKRNYLHWLIVVCDSDTVSKFCLVNGAIQTI